MPDIKIIYGYNFVAPLKSIESKNTRQTLKPPLPTHPPCRRHKCMVPYETPTEIVALNILQS